MEILNYFIPFLFPQIQKKIPGFYEQEIESFSLLPEKESSLAKEKLVNYVDFIIYLI